MDVLMDKKLDENPDETYKFLVVEDEDLVKTYYKHTRDIFPQIQHIEFADSYDDALSELTDEEYDVVLTGRTQDGEKIQNGFEFLNKVEKYSSEIITGVVSCYEKSTPVTEENAVDHEDIYDFYISDKNWPTILEKVEDIEK